MEVLREYNSFHGCIIYRRLLNRTRDTVLDIKENTEYDPGWIQNGGVFIARSKVKLFFSI